MIDKFLFYLKRHDLDKSFFILFILGWFVGGFYIFGVFSTIVWTIVIGAIIGIIISVRGTF